MKLFRVLRMALVPVMAPLCSKHQGVIQSVGLLYGGYSTHTLRALATAPVLLLMMDGLSCSKYYNSHRLNNKNICNSDQGLVAQGPASSGFPCWRGNTRNQCEGTGATLDKLHTAAA